MNSKNMFQTLLRQISYGHCLAFFCVVLMFSLFTITSIQAQTATPTPTTNNQSASQKPDAMEMLKQLLAAIDQDDKEAATKIILSGFPANFADGNGNTLLMQAAKKGKTNAAAVLLAGGADPNKIAKNGMTALLLAVAGDHAETIRVLINGGADLNAKNADGFTPIEIAFLSRHQVALEMLRKIQRQADAASMFVVQETLINALAAKDGPKTLRALALGMDVNKGIEDKGDSTPLETAIDNNFQAGVNLLIRAGADVNRKLSNGVPVWWLAMSDAQGEKFDLNILKTLIKAGASLTATSSKGITPLAFAKSQKNPQFAQILTEAGAK